MDLNTVANFIFRIWDYAYSNIFIAKNISNKVKTLFAGQSINFFRQNLGVEIITRKVSKRYTEFVFRYKTSYIQAISNENNEVIYWAITYCGRVPVRIQRPIFSRAQLYTGKTTLFWKTKYVDVFGKSILLNKSSFADVFRGEKGSFRYFISGATASSFAYESLYLGNPSAYQTIIIGINDFCSRSYGMYQYLDVSNQSTEKQIENFRKKSRINTYGETAPFMGEEILKLLYAQHSGNFDKPSITFGVDRIRTRYFND